MKQFVSANDIQEQYERGRRDFSNIVCKNGILWNLDLKGIIFKNSSLEGVSFTGSNLIDSDFSGCSLTWCGFRYTKLRNAKFSKTMIDGNSFEHAEFENTDFQNSEISNSNFIDTEKFKIDLEGTSCSNVMWNISDISPLQLELMIKKMEEGGLSIDKIMYLKERLMICKGKALPETENTDKPKIYSDNVTSKEIQTNSGSYAGNKGTYSGVIEGEYAEKKGYGMIKETKKKL